MTSHITTLAQLRTLYGVPTTASIKKQASELNATYHQWIEQSCFFVIASVSESGVDCTPRGDQAGQAFIIADSKTILIPDRRGNNRLDTLSNIVVDPRVALLFFIPGIEQTLRVIGRAVVSADHKILEQFAHTPRPPLSCITVSIEAVYFQNSRAMARSQLWTAEHIKAHAVPTPEQMINSIVDYCEPKL